MEEKKVVVSKWKEWRVEELIPEEIYHVLEVLNRLEHEAADVGLYRNSNNETGYQAQSQDPEQLIMT